MLPVRILNITSGRKSDAIELIPKSRDQFDHAGTAAGDSWEGVWIVGRMTNQMQVGVRMGWGGDGGY